MVTVFAFSFCNKYYEGFHSLPLFLPLSLSHTSLLFVWVFRRCMEVFYSRQPPLSHRILELMWASQFWLDFFFVSFLYWLDIFFKKLPHERSISALFVWFNQSLCQIGTVCSHTFLCRWDNLLILFGYRKLPWGILGEVNPFILPSNSS